MKFLFLFSIIGFFFFDVVTARPSGDAVDEAESQIIAFEGFISRKSNSLKTVYFVNPDTQERCDELFKEYREYEIDVVSAVFQDSGRKIVLEVELRPIFEDIPVQKRSFIMYKSRLSHTNWMLFDQP